MTETITRLFDSYAHAGRAVAALKAHNFTDDMISLLYPGDNAPHDTTRTEAGEGAEIGAGVGGALGAGAGLLTGLGMMAIPGVGPVVAAGWFAVLAAGALAGAVAGGATGGIIGSLISAGVDETDAHIYAEGMRRGGSLVTVRVPDERAVEARQVLTDSNAVDTEIRAAAYRKEGWKQFDEKAKAYAPAAPAIALPHSPNVPAAPVVTH
jgi:hypothetical protein